MTKKTTPQRVPKPFLKLVEEIEKQEECSRQVAFTKIEEGYKAFKMFGMNKRGNSDLLFIVIIIAIIAIFLPASSYVMNTLADALTNSTDVELAQQAIGTVSNAYTSPLDYLFATIFFGLYLGAIVLAYFLRTDPVFIIVGILMLILVSWLGVYLADAYYDISTSDSPVGEEIRTNYPITKFIMDYFVELEISLGVLVTIVMYFKSKWGN